MRIIFQCQTFQIRKHNEVCYFLISTDEISTGFMDLTGLFTQKSSQGHEYILVRYHYDSNLIHGIPVKNRKGSTISESWEKLNEMFSKAGEAPSTWVLDNETSKELKESFKNANVTYQLVTPYKHRNNQAERAIQTYTHHLKAGLASVDPNFPLAEWHRVIEQENITINLLRTARVNPKLSAYSYIFG